MDAHRPVALITGASSGIGRAAVDAFVDAGFEVAAAVRAPDRCAPFADGAVRLIEMDVTVDESVTAAVEDLLAELGRVDVVINNAGAGQVGELERLSMADLQWSLDVNYLGVARVTKAVLPLMRRQRSGRLIAVTSLGGVVGQPFNESYCAAKFATEGMYESLRPVLAEFGIHVSIVEPGLVATPFVDKIAGTSGWQADDRPPDDEYAPLLAAYLAHMASPSVVGQPAEAVASLLVEIATSDEPVLRYQSSPAATAVARLKLADLDGQRVSTLTRGWLQA